jgi:hypothetical protein
LQRWGKFCFGTLVAPTLTTGASPQRQPHAYGTMAQHCRTVLGKPMSFSTMGRFVFVNLVMMTQKILMRQTWLRKIETMFIYLP